MNRHQRRAARARTKSDSKSASSPEAVKDRMHFLHCNLGEARVLAKDLPPNQIIAICDTRDPVARRLVACSDLSAEQIRQHEASMMGQPLIPTVIVAVHRDIAVEVLSRSNPSVANSVETAIGDFRVVVAITAGGTTAALVPKENDRNSPNLDLPAVI